MSSENNRNMYPRNKYLDLPYNLVRLSMYIIFPLLGLMCTTGVICYLISGNLNLSVSQNDSLIITLLQFSLPMLIMLGLLPTFFKLRIEHRPRIDLGLSAGRIRITVVVCTIALIIFIMSAYFLFSKRPHNTYTALSTPWIIIIHYIIVGIAEELFVRSTLLDELQKSFSILLSATLSSIIFAFVLHSNSDFISNLIIRLPLGFFLVGIRNWSKSIVPPIFIHTAYNISISTIQFVLYG